MSARPSDPTMLPIQLDYLLNGSPMEFSEFAFIIDDYCDSEKFTYSVELKTVY